MIFLIGGSFQGMEEYARDVLGAGEICTLTEESRSLNTDAPAVSGIDRFVLGMVRRGEPVEAGFRAQLDALTEKIVIGTDLSCGVVPMDAQQRLWREENGRTNNLLAARAERVVRLFCGLPQVLK